MQEPQVQFIQGQDYFLEDRGVIQKHTDELPRVMRSGLGMKAKVDEDASECVEMPACIIGKIRQRGLSSFCGKKSPPSTLPYHLWVDTAHRSTSHRERQSGHVRRRLRWRSSPSTSRP